MLIHPDDCMWPPAELSVLTPAGLSLLGLRAGHRMPLIGSTGSPDVCVEVEAVGPRVTGAFVPLGNRAPGWHRRQVDLMRVLLTRPAGQAEELGAVLTAHGVEWLGEPLLRIVPVAWDPGVLAGRAALLVTSANASRELLRVPGVRRDCPVFAVGPATAAPLQAAGFSNVQAAGGTAVSLIAHVRRHADPQAGRLLHVSGRDIALDLGSRPCPSRVRSRPGGRLPRGRGGTPEPGSMHGIARSRIRCRRVSIRPDGGGVLQPRHCVRSRGRLRPHDGRRDQPQGGAGATAGGISSGGRRPHPRAGMLSLRPFCAWNRRMPDTPPWS